MKEGGDRAEEKNANPLVWEAPSLTKKKRKKKKTTKEKGDRKKEGGGLGFFQKELRQVAEKSQALSCPKRG